MQADFLTCDIIAAYLSAASLLFDHQESYEVGLVVRAAKKRSPLLDPVTWHHDLKIFLLDIPAFLIESSRYVAKTTSIL